MLFEIKDKEIALFNKINFENKGGKEYIFDKISNLLLEQNYLQKNIEDINDTNDNNCDENNILEFISFIQYKLLNTIECL